MLVKRISKVCIDFYKSSPLVTRIGFLAIATMFVIFTVVFAVMYIVEFFKGEVYW